MASMLAMPQMPVSWPTAPTAQSKPTNFAGSNPEESSDTAKKSNQAENPASSKSPETSDKPGASKTPGSNKADKFTTSTVKKSVQPGRKKKTDFFSAFCGGA